ncbi:MAG: low molecular weight protein arginine phosphatase [Candidatus Aureabacteria bacterium]|nr:low molecular weight protein arginine phosphatase [Candidatus Auribacterota bacterium]
MDKREKAVLFVCTGNSCRSQMAEGYMKEVLKNINKMDVIVYSAGLAAYEGSSPSAHAIQVLSDVALDISGNKAKPVTGALVEASDIILGMTWSHVRELEERFPESKKKIYLLREFEENHNPKDPDVFDPIGLPMHAYENCFELMKPAIEKVADII